MPRTRVYVDTSVFGGVDDEEFAEPSRRFFERVKRGVFVVLLSPLTVEELADAPEPVRSVLPSLPTESVERVRLDHEVRALAQAYLDAAILGPESEDDAVHVAAATVARADLILSWNFRHLVRYDNIRKFNGVNALKGYPSIDIRSPLEFSHGDDEEEDL